MMHSNQLQNHGLRLGLILALVGLISAARMNGPIPLASAQTVAGSLGVNNVTLYA